MTRFVDLFIFLLRMSRNKHLVHPKLGQFFSTAICGNDILSSALYVSGIAIVFAGVYAPIILLMVAMVLFLYRTVYREVVEALPVNGGAYNALLNATSKTIAALAGVMTTLSYIATAVLSAKTAVEYLFKFLQQLSEQMHWGISFIPYVIPTVVLVMFGFALLVISGVKDSARIAAAIFTFHVVTLTSFALFGLYLILSGSHTFGAENLLATRDIVTSHGGFLNMFYLAFSACLLGVSGFESSANFVEEQHHGVFRKTLRNMTIGVMVFNPLIAYIVINLMSISDIAGAKDFLLAEAALRMGGMFFLGWIAINAFLVLCGAVLTSYIGVSGLVHRMALDDCLPSILLKKNSRGSHPRIILTFFVLCTSILLVTKGDLLSLAGVYTISFLGVMSLFAISNLILRQTRSELKRPYRAPFLFVVLAAVATLSGMLGNILIDRQNVEYFLTYFIPAIVLTLGVIYRRDTFQSLSKLFTYVPFLRVFFHALYMKTTRVRFYAFIHNTENLFPILNYINSNENGWNVTIVHCEKEDKCQAEQLREILPALGKAGAFTHFNIDLKYVNKPFSPQTVEEFATKHRIPHNRIFIGAIHHYHPFDYSDFNGVRIISS